MQQFLKWAKYLSKYFIKGDKRIHNKQMKR